MDKKISIIIPFYNVEEYVDRCMRSILQQTYENIEVICVDDGSTDLTEKKLKKYLNLDKRVQYLRTVNGGLSAARNAGLEIVTGSFVVFVDGDDFVSKYYIEDLYTGIKMGADISLVNRKIIYSYHDNYINSRNVIRSKELILPKDAVKRILYQNPDNEAWGKMYPAAYFENLRYPVGQLYEDIPITHELLSKTSRVAIIDVEDYYYFQRKDSIVNRDFNEKKLDIIIRGRLLEELIMAKYPELLIPLSSKLLSAYSNVFMQAMSSDRKKHKKSIDQLWMNIQKNRKRLILKNVKNRKTLVAVYISMLGKELYYRVFKLYRRS
ncbi:glycosyltransferase family 2 protein [Latilactobacillus curvatus]